MRGPARLWIVLVFAAAAQAAAASDRFVPADPGFVVANVKQAIPDLELRALIAGWRASPDSASASLALAAAFLERARSLREPMYVGRAEAVLATAARAPNATAAQRRLYAETLQYRHEFAAAEALLDTVLRDSPNDPAARIQRASVRLVRGEFVGARADCAQLLARGAADPAVAAACLAEAYAGSGEFEQARALLGTFPAGIGAGAAGAARAYLLAVRAELSERGNDLNRAIADYRAALSLAPGDDSIRAALADALAASGRRQEACNLLDIEKPSLALLVRRARLAQGTLHKQLVARATSWVELEAARGDSPHAREEALLALDGGDPVRALRAALANFTRQKELPDVRVLARAAVTAGNADARRLLDDWLHSSGYRDAVTETILAAAPRG